VGSAADHPARRRRPRRRTLLLALAGALLVAIAAILYTTAPGKEPRAAAQRPTGPSLDQRLREALTPALRAGARLSSELSSLVPGAEPGDARDRTRAAIPVTAAARTAVRDLRVATAAERLLRDRAQRAVSAQSEYLEVVRATLRLQADDRQLDALERLSARLVSRLERIETAIPRASETVAGARRLRRWASAELAATQPPSATLPAGPAAPQAQPAVPTTPTATATPTPAATATPAPTVTPAPTAEPTPSIDEHAVPPIHRRRARLRRHLEALVTPGAEGERLRHRD
jgi:hypothetical protein